VLYDADTLDEIWPEKRLFANYFWMDKDMLRNNRVLDNFWDAKKPNLN